MGLRLGLFSGLGLLVLVNDEFMICLGNPGAIWQHFVFFADLKPWLCLAWAVVPALES